MSAVLGGAGLVPHTPAIAQVVKSVRVGASESGARIVFDLDHDPQYEESLAADGSALTVRIKGAKGAGATVGEPLGLVQSVDRAETEDGATFIFPLSERSRIAKTLLIPPNADSADFRLMIDLAAGPSRALSLADYDDGGAARTVAREGGDCAHIRLDRTPDRETGAEAPDLYRCVLQPDISWKNPYLVEVAYFPERLTLSQTQRLGGDVVAGQKHIFAGSLDATRSYRTEVDAAINLIDGDETDLTLKFGLFDTQRPLMYTRGGVGDEQFNRWRSNSVADAAVSLSALDGRLTFSSGGGYAETALRRHTEEEPWLWLYEDQRGERTDSAGAVFGSLSAKILDADTAKATVDFSYTNTEPRYHAYQTYAPADVFYEGETLSARASGLLLKSRFTLQYQTHAEVDYGFDSARLQLNRGAISLRARLIDETVTSSDLALMDDRTTGGEVALNLGKVVKSDGVKNWLPDEIRVGYSTRAADEATLLSSEAARRQSIGFGATKTTEHFLTDVYVFWNARNDFSDFADFRASTQFGADVSQSFFGDDWDFSLYANMSDLKRERRHLADGDEQTLSGGASFTKKFEKIPTIRLAFDAFQFSAEYVRDEYAFQNHDLSLRAEADISEMLFTGENYIIDDKRPLSLYFAAYRGWSAFDDTLDEADKEAETRVMLLLRKSR